MQKILLGIVALGIVFGGAYYWKQSNGSQSVSDGSMRTDGPAFEVPVGTVYYYGEECPHCKDVMKFLEDNKIAEKVTFEKKEVWHDTKNAAEMAAAAKFCGLDVNKIGVPFLFAEGKCHIGTPDVEAYFRQAAGI